MDLPVGEQHARIMELIKTLTAQVLGLESPQLLEEDIGFFDQGMDSLTAIELRNALQNKLGETMPATLLFKYPTVRDLTVYLAEHLLCLVPTGTGSINESPSSSPEPSSPEPSSPEPSSPEPSSLEPSSLSDDHLLVEDVTSMSDEELAMLIDGELNELMDNHD